MVTCTCMVTDLLETVVENFEGEYVADGIRTPVCTRTIGE